MLRDILADAMGFRGRCNGFSWVSKYPLAAEQQKMICR